MPSFCAVLGCSNRSNRDYVRFFKIPSDFQGSNKKKTSDRPVNPLAVERKNKWLEALRRVDLTDNKIKNGFICSRHFIYGERYCGKRSLIIERRNAWIKAVHRENMTDSILMYQRVCSNHFISGKPADLYDKDNPDWVPTQHMGYELGVSRKGRFNKIKGKGEIPSSKKERPSKSPGNPKKDLPPQISDELVSSRSRFNKILGRLFPESDDDDDEEEEDYNDISDDELWPKNLRTPDSNKRTIIDKQKDQGDKYIMKLFDRTIDLAQFNENSPFYPMCRAWFANQPYQIYNIKKEDQPDDEAVEHSEIPKEGETESEKNVYKLPPPEPMDKTLRFPDLIPYKSAFNSFMKEGEEPPSKEDLLRDNLQHWLKVRKSWREASLRNECRYEKSIRILTSIYFKPKAEPTDD